MLSVNNHLEVVEFKFGFNLMVSRKISIFVFNIFEETGKRDREGRSTSMRGWGCSIRGGGFDYRER